MTGPIIKLEAIHIETAEKFAQRRIDSANALGRKSTNNGPANSDPVASNIHRLGTLAEVAGKLFLNPIKWNAYSENLDDLPDLGEFIDVKGIQSRRHNLILQRTAKEHWAYLLVCGERHPVYEIVGWCWGWIGKDDRFLKEPVAGRPAYFVPPRELRDPNDLRRLIREKPAPAR